MQEIVNNSVLNSFKSEIDKTLGEVLKSNDKVVLLDQPVHRNLGDTFIWQGEIDTLKRLNKKIMYKSVSHRTNWDFIDSLDPEIPLLLHGGGNMGDIWIHYEEFRRYVVERYPNRRIVIFPQTLQYNDKSNLRETAKVFSSAQNLTIISRTHKGIDEYGDSFSENNFIFAPDMALGIDIHKYHSNLSFPKKPLIIQRDDKESKDKRVFVGDNAPSDWIFSERNTKEWHYVSLLNRLVVSKKLPLSAVVATQNIQSELMRYLNMRAAFEMFASASVVVSNRLHAHIFASILGIPNFVSDNNYGKISTIYHEYTHKFPNAVLTESIEESFKKAHIK